MTRKKLLKILTLMVVLAISFQFTAVPVLAASEAESALPTVDSVCETDEIVTGKGEAGAMIIVIFPNGSAKTTIVNSAKTWETNIPDDVTLNYGDEITTIQIEVGKSPSNVVTTTVTPDITVVPAINVEWESLTTGQQYASAGDNVELRVQILNEGRPSSVWQSAVAVIKLDENITFTGTVRINGWNASSSQYSYDSSTHTLTVHLGNITGGTGVNFSFRSKINDNVPGTVTQIQYIVNYY